MIQALIERAIRGAMEYPKATTGFVCFVFGMLFERVTSIKRKG